MDMVNVFKGYLACRVGTNERGAALVEYALLLALIAVAVIGALTLLGGNVNNKFSTVSNSIGT